MKTILIILTITAIVILCVYCYYKKKEKVLTYAEHTDLLINEIKDELEKSGGKYIPQYTFPIKGICKDGELVKDVLKRLESEGNADKIKYFKEYMNLD